jgi:hypothetical protein
VLTFDSGTRSAKLAISESGIGDQVLRECAESWERNLILCSFNLDVTEAFVHACLNSKSSTSCSIQWRRKPANPTLDATVPVQNPFEA